LQKGWPYNREITVTAPGESTPLKTPRKTSKQATKYSTATRYLITV